MKAFFAAILEYNYSYQWIQSSSFIYCLATALSKLRWPEQILLHSMEIEIGFCSSRELILASESSLFSRSPCLSSCLRCLHPLGCCAVGQGQNCKERDLGHRSWRGLKCSDYLASFGLYLVLNHCCYLDHDLDPLTLYLFYKFFASYAQILQPHSFYHQSFDLRLRFRYAQQNDPSCIRKQLL